MLSHHFTVYKEEGRQARQFDETLTHSDMKLIEVNVCLLLALTSFDFHQCMFTFL